ncbi:hypothetical protein L21SP5_02549 [Salinivirga cyanobacteriivorans]|uniref:Peptidase M1 membrane alanine aminopeptidase domain-containing protein n=1 Tax=Salinivirga cyanobacteriivorans TaxID=1307839 RepID=A0A0S2I1M4_9BACT|nr:hypothetical protein [Salinivirga cyanobacteriivorans]ALO16173.1 hypothetical protein L21SP5_02549 [Salinivirga cyanobacteriivorans]
MQHQPIFIRHRTKTIKTLMMYKKLLITSILLLCIQISHAQPAMEMNLSVEFFPQKAALYGYSVSNKHFMNARARIRLNADSQIQAFYLHSELRIDSIMLKGETIKYQTGKVPYRYNYNGLALKVKLEPTRSFKNSELIVFYSGFFHPSKVRSLSDYMQIDKSSGVFLRGYGYSLWFPVFISSNEDAYTTNFQRISITVPEKFSCVLNGRHLEKKIIHSKRISTWNPGYKNIKNIQVVAAPFQKTAKKHIKFYHQTDGKNKSRVIAFIDSLQNFYSNTYQEPDQNQNIYLVEMPEYGNITAGNMIGITTEVIENFNSSLSARATIAHELVHAYVHMPVQKSNPMYAFIIEGFPGFFHLYALDQLLPEKEFSLKAYMKKIKAAYAKKQNTGKDRWNNELPEEKPILAIQADEIGNYKDRFILNDRVRLFLYDLYLKMGKKKFEIFIKQVLNGKITQYEDFADAITAFLPGYEQQVYFWLKTTDPIST